MSDAPKTYMGDPCKHGHDGKRYKNGGCCVECMKVRSARRGVWMRNTPEGKACRKGYNLKAKYDLSPGARNFMLAGQQFRCGLCGTDEPGSSHGWHTDHCHKTNEVRGILCNMCNHGLGKLGDTPESLYRAYLYTKGEFTWTQTTNSTPPMPATVGQPNHWPNTAQVESPYTPLFLVM